MRYGRIIAAWAAASGLAGCATPRPAADCGPVTGEQKADASTAAIDQAFGAVRQGYYRHVESEATDARGDLATTYHRIGPASEAQPPVGQGARLTVVTQRCTGKLLRAYRP